jgi:hypothetical protein
MNRGGCAGCGLSVLLGTMALLAVVWLGFGALR